MEHIKAERHPPELETARNVKTERMESSGCLDYTFSTLDHLLNLISFHEYCMQLSLWLVPSTLLLRLISSTTRPYNADAFRAITPGVQACEQTRFTWPTSVSCKRLHELGCRFTLFYFFILLTVNLPLMQTLRAVNKHYLGLFWCMQKYNCSSMQEGMQERRKKKTYVKTTW